MAKKYDAIKFRNGYMPTSPVLYIELHSIRKGVGNSEWGAYETECYILSLGKILTPEEAQGKKLLHLPLIRKWFDLIASGVKKEEYRVIKPHWNKRFM